MRVEEICKLQKTYLSRAHSGNSRSEKEIVRVFFVAKIINLLISNCSQFTHEIHLTN